MALSEAAIGGIISAAGAAASAGASAIATGNLNKKNREWQEQQSREQRLWSEMQTAKQNAWNYEMWLKEQDYNTPENQMQRLRDAGLNPLYYGLDGNSTGQAQAAAQPLGYERASQYAVANPVQSAFDAAMKVAQVSNIQADTAKKNNETLTETQRREKIIADIDETRQEIKNKIANEKLTDTQRERLEKDIEWLDKLNEATLAEKESTAKLNNSQQKRIEELLEGEKIMQSKTIEDFEHKWKKIDAEIAKIAGENAILAKDLENYALNHANNGFMGTGLSLQNLIRGGKSIGQTIKDNPKTQEGKSILAEDNR